MTKDEALTLSLEALNKLTDVFLDTEGNHGDYEQKAINQGNKAIDAIKEAFAQQDSKDKEQAKTDSFVRQLDEALANPEPWEKFCDSNCVWTDHHPDCKLAEPEYDYKDLYEKEKRKSAMWLSKYEEVAGPAPKAIPMAKPEQEPVAWMRTSGTGSPVVTEALLVEMPEMRWNFQKPLYTKEQL